MASLYRRFLKICELWPTNSRNTLGEHIRKNVESRFKHGESSHIEDQVKCEKTLNSLELIASNHYKNKYPRKSDTSYSGLDLSTLTKGIDEMHKKIKK